MPHKDKVVGIVGCGWLGFSLAKYLLASGYASVRGSTTTPGRLTELRGAGIDAGLAVLDPAPRGGHWDALLQADSLIVDIPPRLSRQGVEFHPLQMRHLADRIENGSSVSEIIYTSSTSVYPPANRVVVEADVVQPGESASPPLVEAERIVASLRTSARKAAILRLGGLMGYDRIPGKYVRGKQNLTTGNIPVNYLHRDDAVGILAALLEAGVADETYNAVAPLHPVRQVVYESSCRQNGWEVPTFVVSEEEEPYKVVSSDKLTRSLNYHFLYPDPLRFPYD